MSTENPSAEYPFEPNYCEVLGSKMHYIDVGEGDPILFLHGNPTSSYLWRNVIPELQDVGRCIAPDLIGMGKSDKPDIDYTFVDHAKYLEAFIAELGLKNVTLVIHDWGSALGFHYAMRHQKNVRGIAFMEGILQTAKMSQMPKKFQQIFKTFRTPVIGAFIIKNLNFFVDKLLPMSVIRKLGDKEMAYYRAPYPDVQSRKPLHVWPNQIPFDGHPADVYDIVTDYRAALEESELPKLLLWFKPGALINKHVVADAEKTLPNLKVVYLGSGIHFVQEDQPSAIGREVLTWMQETDQ